ncbi:MAG: response regulator [Candidatus Saganbacteria bacterium]|nr:response regulator [Candidatus Saganbacteria bacterium]
MSEGKNRILLIEDEEDIVEALRLRLEANGYEVIAALDGTDGLNKARTAAPDLIILDIMLPKLDGYKIARMLKFDEKFAMIPIVMLTAKVQPTDIQRGQEAGADGYITKPFKADDLLAEIKRLIQK